MAPKAIIIAFADPTIEPASYCTFSAVWAKITFIEPFAGGLAVALGHLPRSAILNDINPHLINLYRSVRDGLDITLPLINEEDIYYEYRARFNELISAGEAQTTTAASLFYYLNRTGFNGLCRFNKAGFYNVPFGKYSSIPYRTSFPELESVFANWSFKGITHIDVKIHAKRVFLHQYG